MCYFLPKGGQIKSVAVYWTDKRIKEDGPVGLFDNEIDKAQILDSVESCRRYYAVVECDSTDTAKFMYKDFINVFSYIGVTRKMLELRFIPDLMDFDDHLHDIAKEEPTTFGGPDLVHLISAKDLEQIGIVTHRRKPKRRFISEMWGDSGLNESLDISDGNDEDALEAPSGTKMRVVDNTNPRIGDPSARKAAFPAIKLSCGTTIVGVPLKNSLGTYLAADGLARIHVPGEEHEKKEYGNNVKIHCLGEP
ncbi:hypothetical protein MKX03_022540 [Papaver bracteatum]|nr:hypothetical protein MKX03_022540 [Papaver bracteatum]